MASIRRNGIEIDTEQFVAAGWRSTTSSRAEKRYQALLSLRIARERRIAAQRALRTPYGANEVLVKSKRIIRFG